MGSVISTDFILIPLLEALLVLYNVVPFSRFWTYYFVPTGLIKLVAHRKVLERLNLYRTPNKPIPPGYKVPTEPPRKRPDDGFGTDIKNPTTAMEGAPIGRNMPGLPKHLRDPHGKPEVQLVAQRLLAREGFSPAGAQLNVMAASWIQAMVHDWIGHFDGENSVTLDSNTTETGAKLCPFAKSPFSFKETKERPDRFFESERTNWWDASFVYGNNAEQLKDAKSPGGKMVVGKSPFTMAERCDGTYIAGDNKNSWVGVALLQDLFIREHNWIAEKIKQENPNFTDDEVFDKTRIVVSALVAKIHTNDWTCELLKTRLLRIGLQTNWDGLLKSWFGLPIPGVLSKMGEKKGKKSNNQGTPFCLTEEFAAVYRLHSLSPPGLILGDDKSEFVRLEDLVGDQGREEMKKTDRPEKMMKSVLDWPCGSLTAHNYPNAFRNVSPTDNKGKNLRQSDNIDLAALDLYRDRERGILKFNEFRRQLHLKPYMTWMELTGYKEDDARKLELIYGPAEAGGIERLDLLVGDMYEAKVQPSFALSETSFIIFLLLASRRLDADPFLNEYYTEEYYSKFGLAHVKQNGGLLELLERHYPDIAEEFKSKHSTSKPSAFTPTLGPDDWANAISSGVVPKDISAVWETTKEENKKYFNALEKETEIYTKNLKSNTFLMFKPEWIWIVISILLVIIPYYVSTNYENAEYSIQPLYPIDLAKEFAFSNVRHEDSLNRILHLFTNPLIFIAQSYLLDLTPPLFGLSITLPIFGKFKFNAAGFYFSYLAIYAFILDTLSGTIHLVYLLIFYQLLPRFGKYVTRLVGPRYANLFAFILYLFGQGSQILFGHLGRENYYDWNFYQLFHIQQLITVFNIMRIFKILPYPEEDLVAWEKAMENCMGKIYFVNCELKDGN